MDIRIPTIRLSNGRSLGGGYPVYIIAEIGSNHDGDLERGKKLIHLAKEAGADAVKFQSFQVENLINQSYRSNHQWKVDPSWKLLEKLSLPLEWHAELKKEAERVGIDFLSTPFDLKRLELLVKMDVPAIKIASGDLTYHELIRSAGQSGKPVLLSTGHATLGEVEAALKVLWEAGCKDIVLLHCASVYPASFEDANIHAMCSMHHGFQVLVGYSDHTPGTTVPLGAVALGACVIEKHFTDDKTRAGPDHNYALDVKEFAEMVTQIRQMELALARGAKIPRPREKEERIMARRAIYTNQPIMKGNPITREMVKIVRHCYPEGISADQWNRLEGCAPRSDIKENTLITWEMV